MKLGCIYGTHRSLEPLGALPQSAYKIDNQMQIYANEILIKVDTLNIDAASFTQIEKEAQGDEKKIAQKILEIVSLRGKMHNLVTGSGGMFIGKVKQVGEALLDKIDLKKGDLIASLVSLSLTPLKIKKIKKIDLAKDQVKVDAQAILFESGIYAKLPSDIPPSIALAVLDVAGAPLQTAKLVKVGDKVLIIGAGGKSGILCLYEAKKRAGITGKVIALIHSEKSKDAIKKLNLADIIFCADARFPVKVLKKVEEITNGELADLTINCVNIPGTEMSSILSTRQGGTVYFFSMATSFTAAALGAEGAGKDLTMIIGNGYAKNHADFTLNILRESKNLRNYFEKQYSK